MSERQQQRRQRPRILRGWDAFQTALGETAQQVETTVSKPRIFVRHQDVETVDPGEHIADYWDTVKTTPIVRASLVNFAFDVTEPGLRIDGPDAAVTYLEEEWLPQAGVVSGERHQPFDPLLPQIVLQRWGRGGMILEHVRDDADDAESTITGVRPIRPETGVFQTLKNKNILVDPDDDEDDVDDAVRTRRDELAAFIQWHEGAVVDTRGRDQIPLSTNDFTRTTFGGDIGSLWGTPVTETVDDDVTGFKNILRDKETAIKTKAWGLWSIGFGREVLEYVEDGIQRNEIIEWSSDEQDEFVDEHIDSLGPGDIVTHDGLIDMDRLDGEVPELIDDLLFYVSNITSAMPTPLYIVGFEKNINQFVTEKQDERYALLRNTEREALGTFLTDLFSTVVEHNTDTSADELEVQIVPPDEESPILSLTDEEIDRIKTFADAIKALSGMSDPSMFIDDDVLRDLILQLPDDAAPDLDEEVPEETPEELQDRIDELEAVVGGDTPPGAPGNGQTPPPQQPPPAPGADEGDESE